MFGKKTVLLAAIAVLSVFAASVHARIQPPAGVEVKEPDSINAGPMDEAGSYHVMPVFKSLESVKIIKRGGPYGEEHTRTLKKGQYAFDQKKGLLKLKVEVDNEKEMVIVSGERVVPWEWLTAESLAPGSVKILLKDRTAVPGEDYTVDEKKGLIKYLKEEYCDPQIDYYISYQFVTDPSKPNVGRGGSIGNHRDQKAVRRFLGLAEEEGAAADTARTVGTNAAPTADPGVYTIKHCRMFSQGMKVAISARDQSVGMRWLKEGEDYTYDEENGLLTLLGDLRLDDEKEMLFVHGVVAEKDPGLKLVSTTGTEAKPTAVPRVFSIAHCPLKAQGFRVAVADREAMGKFRWLKENEDYYYVEERAEIILLKEIPMESESEYLFVSGDRKEG